MKSRKQTKLTSVKNRMLSTWVKAMFAAGVFVLILVALLLGRGLSVNLYKGNVKVESIQSPNFPKVAETFGAGSGIAGESGSITKSYVKGVVASKLTPVANQSAAKYVTHGPASPIAVGPGSQADATLEAQ